MRKHYCFTKPAFVLAVLLLAGACAAQPAAEQPPQTTKEANTGDDDVDTVQASERTPIDTDVMYRVLAGEYLGSEGDYPKAAGEYLEAALNSDDPAIAQRATRVAISTQSWQQAAMAADRWALLEPHSLDAHEMATISMLRVGDYSGAEHQMGQILELLKHDRAHAWEMIATLLSRSENPKKATAVLQRLLVDYGSEDNVHALYAQSQLAARTGDFDNARRLADMAVALEPERIDLLTWAGRLAVNQEDEDSAIDYYRKAWKLNPRQQDVALAYAELLNRTDSQERARQVLEGLPDTPEVRFTRIVQALEAGDTPLANRIFDGFPESSEDDPSNLGFFAGQGAELLGRFDEAIAWYSQVTTGERAVVAVLREAFLLAQTNRLEEARNVLARMRVQRNPAILIESFEAESAILRQAGQISEAFDILGQGLELLPGNTRLIYAQALVAVELGKIDFAEQALRSVIQREPGNAAALNALGYTLADLTDRLGEAEELIQAAYAIAPNEASIVDSMGWIAYRQGRLREAEQYLRDALALDQNPEIAAHLGEVLWESGQQDAARLVWAEALNRSGSNKTLLDTMTRFGISP
jgi:tetratricopeptide (TPR) repeat protein